MKHLFATLLICITIASQSQMYVGAGIGASATKNRMALELQTGYKYKFLVAQTGFVTHTDNTNPAVFQLKAGINIKIGDQAIILAGGYSYHLQSTSTKDQNRGRPVTSIEYLKHIAESGAWYSGVTYTGKLVFVTVGLKYFFVK